MQNIFVLNADFSRETNAETKVFQKGDVVVKEGERSAFFYFLVSGELSVMNLTEEGKEFLQHKVTQNSFFGEPAVLLEKPFPGSVEVSSEKAEVLKISRLNFINYLKNHPDQFLEFTMSVAEKSIKKSHNLKNLIFLNPEDRILKQLNDYKHSFENPEEKTFINLTRKELSNMTGLRIETVIRAVKKMEKEGRLEIHNGKILF